MTIPALTEHGLLPPGVHDALLEQVPPIFCGTEYRQNLWDRAIVQFLPELKIGLGPAVSSIHYLIIGGSFLSDKERPGDVELTTVLQPTTPGDICWQVQCMWHQNFRQWKQSYGADFYPSLPGQNDFSLFFQYVGEKTALAKGLNAKDQRGVLRFTSW